MTSEKPQNTRWHHDLHPALERHQGTNGLPRPLHRSLHPTHGIITSRNDIPDIHWTSRNHRKARYQQTSPLGHPRSAETLMGRISNLGRVEYWNVSWWVAVAFTLGSVIWVINGFASFLPFCNSHFETAPNSMGWTAWLGATIFELGSIFGMWEAWNRDDAANFGWAVQSTWKHPLRIAGISESSGDLEKAGFRYGNLSPELQKPKQRWIWFSVDKKYWREVGFLAAFFQLCGATIFWISGFTALPAIQGSISKKTALQNGVFWTPQVIGGSGFIISSIFIMLETQSKWYIPRPLSLGWHVGLWNFVGAIGFTLCGALGYAAENNSGAAYQSALSTFWGGWAFLIGSIIQWYEAVNPA